MAASAHLITVGLEGWLNANIRSWFTSFNFLPPIPLTAGQIDTIPAPATFEHLLELMIRSSYKNFILIIHGFPDGSGLWLPMANGQGDPHTSYNDLRTLMTLGETLNRHDQRVMGISKAHIHKILDLMHKVQDKKIECIEFRSCNLGKNPSSLNRFREFFGARRAGAPDLHTLFGEPVVGIGDNFLKTHASFHPGGNWETENYPYGLAKPRLVCCFQLVAPLQKPEKGGHIGADTDATFDSWVKEYITKNGGRKGTKMPVHGLWIADEKTNSKDPDAPKYLPVAIDMDDDDVNNPLGGWGNDTMRRFIPPLSKRYGKHIIYST